MKKLALWLCGLASILLAPTSMFADTIFNFSFQTNSNYGYLADVPYGGSGQLDTQATNTPGVYLIVGATGKLTGGPLAINGLPITGVGQGGSADNLLTVTNGVGSFAGTDGVDLLFSSGDVFFSNGVNPINQFAGVQLLAYLYYQDGPVTRQASPKLALELHLLLL